MNTILQDNLYLILIVVGGVFVSIQSRVLYSTPLIQVNASWLGKELHLQDLTGKRRFEVGYIFYLCPILFIYLMISVSPELLSLSMGVAGTSASVGALSLSVSDASTFAPILAAVAVNTLTTIKPVSILEQYIRAIAHGVAGIPHYLQRMVRKIREATQNLDSLPVNPTYSAQQSMPYSENGSLQQSIKTIRQLHELTLGSTGGRVWSGQATEILDKTHQGLNNEYNRFLAKMESFNAGQGQTHVASTPEHREDESGEIVLLATNLRRKFMELLAIVIANQDEPLSPIGDNPELYDLLVDLVKDGQRIRKDRALIRLFLGSTLTGIGVCLLPATLFYFTLFIFDDFSMQNFSLHSDEQTLLIRGMPLGQYYQSTLVTGFKLAWWNVLSVGLLFGAGCSAALCYRANLRRVRQWELWKEDSHPVGQYAVISLLAVLFAAIALETLLFLKLVVLPAGRFSGAGQFTSILQDFNLNYIEYGYYGLMAAPFAVLMCYLSDKLVSFGTDKEIMALSHLGRIIWVTLVGGLIGQIGIKAFVDGTHEWQTTLLGTVVPTFTLFVLAWRYWTQGLEYQRNSLVSEERGELHGHRGNRENPQRRKADKRPTPVHVQETRRDIGGIAENEDVKS